MSERFLFKDIRLEIALFDSVWTHGALLLEISLKAPQDPAKLLL